MKSHFAFDMRVQSNYLILADLFVPDDVTIASIHFKIKTNFKKFNST